MLIELVAFSLLVDPYEALRARRYEEAIAAFLGAIEAAPQKASLRKDLAYTYLKVGEAEAARDQFAEAMRIDPNDRLAALEYAFLANETRQQAQARRVFDRIRKTGDPTAEQAFQNIDRPLAEGIARWQKALELAPDNFSGHFELATLAEQRDDLELAAEHYEKAWRLRPELRSLMVALGRVRKAQGKTEQANALLLAASRSRESRPAEEARELLYSRYPYVYEFRQAIQLDPKNAELRRELAYLLLEMGQNREAEEEFRLLLELAPDDLVSSAQLGLLRLKRDDLAGALPLLEKVLQGADEELADRVRSALKLPQTLRRPPETPRSRVSTEAKVLAENSYKAGYLKDALKYFQIAQAADPVDSSILLKLGWTYNLLHDDRQAIRWFALARKSPDRPLAQEAERAYRNLRTALARFRTTAWVFPLYSSRWRDLFSYGQVKTEMRLGRLPLRPYVSLRFIGDTRGSTQQPMPQYLSESSLIAGLGVASALWHGLMGWAEAGSAINYLGGRKDVGKMIPDYRGGLAYGKGFGHLLGGESRGLYYETNDDGVFLSRFQNDLLLYSQHRIGCTISAGAFQSQLYWNGNVTVDIKRQDWANFVEMGPGVRFRWRWMPKALAFSVNALQGAYTLRASGARRPNFTDIRVGVWYAITK